jgi:cysteinyl-tRNA synthetase, unknown class
MLPFLLTLALTAQAQVPLTPLVPRAPAPGTKAPAAESPNPSPASLTSVQRWGFLLQGPDGGKVDLAALAKSELDLVVIDHADLGIERTPEEVERLKKRPDGRRRIVLSYFSIGEAEDYRFYWRPEWKQQRPAFLAPENPQWPGNFKVRYWMPEWHRLIVAAAPGEPKSYLDRIVDAGFDGVYLDIVDAFEFFGPSGNKERSTAAADMSALVQGIARHARTQRGQAGFLVIPQNGANILEELTAEESVDYLLAIDGIGAEDTFYFGTKPENNPLNVQRHTLAFLERFRDAGKVVLAVDYVTKKSEVARFTRLARAHGFIPHVAKRTLDRLLPQPAPP